MNNGDRNLFDRLDSIENQNEEILKKINQLGLTKQSVPQTSQKQLSDKEALAIFIKKAKKEYLWFGPTGEFLKSQKLLFISCIGLLIIGLISTILTTKAFGLYSTYTLFENIIVLETCFILYHTSCSTKLIADTELKNHHCDIFDLNSDQVWCSTGKEKKRYKWLRKISYVAVIANIIIIWTNCSGGIAVAATIFEILFLAITVVSHILRIDLYCMYNIVIITGRNLNDTETVKIVYYGMSRKIMTFNEFEEKFKALLDS